MQKISFILITFLISCAPTTEKKSVPVKVIKKESEAKFEVKPCFCMKIYRPVCGDNGRTYGNDCEANCDKVKSWSKGSCKKE